VPVFSKLLKKNKSWLCQLGYKVLVVIGWFYCRS
jgi:hypothetical protein